MNSNKSYTNFNQCMIELKQKYEYKERLDYYIIKPLPILVYVKEYDLLSFNRYQDKYRICMACIRVKKPYNKLLEFYRKVNIEEFKEVEKTLLIHIQILQLLKLSAHKYYRLNISNPFDLIKLRLILQDDDNCIFNYHNISSFNESTKNTIIRSVEYACLNICYFLI